MRSNILVTKQQEQEQEQVVNDTDNDNDKIIKLHSQAEIVPFDLINLNDWNPNFVSKTIQNAIKDDIRKNGFLEVIVLQRKNKKMNKEFVIINGEHRFLALKELAKDEGYKLYWKDPDSFQWKEVDGIPSTIIDVNDKTAKALTIRLNREHGDLMPDKVGKILKDISPTVDIEYINDMVYLPETEILVLTDMAKTMNDDFDSPRDVKNSKKSKNDDNNKEDLDSVEEFLKKDLDNEDRAKVSTTKTTTCPNCQHEFVIAS